MFIFKNMNIYPGLFSQHYFKDFKLHPALQRGLGRLGINRATAVQSRAFVPISARRDASICAETGSGKTLSYLLPLLNRQLYLQDRARAPVVVLCPSVDLCSQVVRVALALDADQLLKFQLLSEQYKPLGQPPSDIFDETSIQSAPLPISSLRIHWGLVDLVVATPAKFLEDFAGTRNSPLPSALVFDEADFILTGANRAEAVEVMDRMQAGGGVQSIFVSATLPNMGNNSVGSILARKFNSAEVVTSELRHCLPPGISTRWINAQSDFDSRAELLAADILPFLSGSRTLVFANTIETVSKLHLYLKGKGWSVARFSKGHEARTVPRVRDAELFSSGDVDILVATDLAARGIDWPDVATVINFDMPLDASAWLHRAGRCGRMGKPGKVVSLVGPTDSEQYLANGLRDRAETGKNLHGLFSSKRSLRKNRREKPGCDPEEPARTVDVAEGVVGWVEPLRVKEKLSSIHS